LLQLLAPKAGERILDVGCGTGQLTQEIAAAGVDAVGVDASAEMIAAARENFPHVRFEVCEATAMDFENEFDAVFSNAALHWVTDQEKAISCIARSLKRGGRFVFEMGGHGNLQEILSALAQALSEVGIENPARLCPWTFPRISAYASLLEARALRVDVAVLFDRPTPLDSGEEGLANWLKMFAGFGLEHLPDEKRDLAIRRVEELARPKLFHGDHWVADYKRLRMVCEKE